MELPERELAIVKKLFELSNQILMEYDKLKDLEANQQPNVNVISILQYLLSKEEKIYNYLKFHEESLVRIIIYLKCSNNGIINYLKVIFNDDYRELAYLRIDERLSDLLSTREFFKPKNFTKSTETTEYHVIFQIECDVANTILRKISERLDKALSFPEKDILLKFKYYLIFIYNHLEKQLMKKEFRIPEELYWCAKFYSDYKNTSENSKTILKDLKWLVGENIMNDFLTDFLKYQYVDYPDEEVAAEMTMIRIIVQSALQFFEPDLQEEILREAGKNSDDEYLSEYICTTIVEGIEDGPTPLIFSLKKE